jgi:hypothetical protein
MVYKQSLLVLAVVFLAIGIGLALAVHFGLDFPYADSVIKALIIIGFVFLAVWVILVIYAHIRSP